MPAARDCKRSLRPFPISHFPLLRSALIIDSAVSSEALPYTLLILLVELTIGGVWVLWAAHWRGKSAESFIKFGAATAVIAAAITFWVAAAISVGEETDGYPLDPDYMLGARVALLLLLILSLP